MEEHDLYDLKRSLETILNFVKFFNTPIDKDAETPQYKYRPFTAQHATS